MMTEQFAVTGMTCAACSAHVEKAVSRLSGVQSAPVNLMLGSMTVTYDEKAVTEGDIIAAVKAAGYGASPASQTDQGQLRRDQDAALCRRKKHLIWSVVFLVPLFYLSMGHMMGLPLPPSAAGLSAAGAGDPHSHSQPQLLHRRFLPSGEAQSQHGLTGGRRRCGWPCIQPH